MAEIRALLRLIAAIVRELDILHLRWAQAEIDPGHDDTGYIAQRLAMRLAQRTPFASLTRGFV